MNESELLVMKLAEMSGDEPLLFVTLAETILESMKDDQKVINYLVMGDVLNSFKKHKMALAILEKAFYYTETDSKEQLACNEKIAETHIYLNDVSKGLELLMNSLKIVRDTGDKIHEANILTQIGSLYNDSHLYDKAILFHSDALKCALELGNLSAVAKGLVNIGVSQRGLNHEKEAAQSLEQALAFFLESDSQSPDDLSGMAICYANLGAINSESGHLKKTQKYLLSALRITGGIDQREVESQCYINLGSTYLRLRDFKEAKKCIDKGLRLANEIQNRNYEANGYLNLGVYYLYVGHFVNAKESLHKALDFFIEADEKVGKSKCYTNLCLIHNKLGNQYEAVKYGQKSLELFREHGILDSSPVIHEIMGRHFNNTGAYQKSIEFQEKAIEIALELGNESVESDCYQNIGISAIYIGDFGKAIRYFKKALELKKKIDDKPGEARALLGLGTALECLKHYQEGLDELEQALEIARGTGNKVIEANCYHQMGIVYSCLESYKKARFYYEKALPIAIKQKDERIEAACYAGIGDLMHKLGHFEEAITTFKKSLDLSIKNSDANSERIVALKLSKCYGALDKYHMAYQFCIRSVELTEKIGRALLTEKDKLEYSKYSLEEYEYLIYLCLKLDKKNEAFNFLEEFKSRAFLDILSTTELNPSIKVTEKLTSLLEKEKECLSKLQVLKTPHLGELKISVDIGEVDSILRQLDSIYEKISEYDQDYVFMRSGKPLSLNRVVNFLSSKKGNNVLVEYFTSKEVTYIFVISSKEKKLFVETVPLSLKKLIRYMEDYHHSVRNYSVYGDIGNFWLDISKYLIAPISEYLEKANLIYFVPYNVLHYFPLHALNLNNEPVIKNHPVSYAPSASLIYFFEKKGSGKYETCASFGVDVFGNVKEPVKEGVEEVNQLFNHNSKPYIDVKASKQNVIQNINKDVVLFICHLKSDNQRPLEGGLLLYDGVLTVREIFNLKLDTEIVVLAACESGIDLIYGGDELIGFSRSFLYAGASSIVVSLWEVNAYSTRRLIVEFFKFLKAGDNKAIALQKSQLKIMKEAKYSHPYHWAPFILIGD